MPAKVKNLSTAAEVITALGGDVKLARRLGLPTQNVWNWRKRGLPARTYIAINSMLRRAGYRAPASLWDMHEAAE
jgi:DNA-binding transcriptional regulator YdaS (Cro superfamily)